MKVSNWTKCIQDRGKCKEEAEEGQHFQIVKL